MTLLRPDFLWLLLLWLPLVFLQWRQRFSARDWQQVIEPELLEAFQKPNSSSKKLNTWKNAWPVITLLGIVAASGPAIERESALRESEGPLLVILDNSLSMAIEDTLPNRAIRAQRMIQDWARSGLFSQTSVVTYSGSAHLLTPLTRDPETLATQLNALSPFVMPSFGNRPDLAFEKINEQIESLGLNNVHVLWLLDDVPAEGKNLPKLPTSKLMSFHLVPVGTDAGGPIPRGNSGGFVTLDGEVVTVGTPTQAIRQLATTLDAAIIALGDLPSPDRWQSLSDEASPTAQTALNWADIGYWLLVPLLALFLWRGQAWSRALLVLLFLPLSEPSWAANWFLNEEQRAHQALSQGDYEQALTLSQDPMRQGLALFEQQKFEQAAEVFSGVGSADGAFNRGNALAHAGKVQQAIAAYEQALERDPNHEGAKKNRELLQAWLDEQQSQQGENQQSSEGGQQQQPSPSDSQGDPNQEGEQAEQNGQPGQPSSETEPQQASESSDENTGDESIEDSTATAEESDENGDEQVAQPDDAMTPEELREEQQAQAIFNRLTTPPAGSVLQQKFNFQYQQNPTDSETPTW